MAIKKVYHFAWRDRGWVGRAITISLLVHVGLIVVSGFIIILHAQLKPLTQFISPPAARPSLEPHKLEMKVKVADLQKASARPRLQPRMVAQRATDIALPEIKRIPNVTDQKIKRQFSSVGASGLGSGIGGGYGSGIGGGRGGGLPLIMSARCDPAERMRRLMQNGGDPKCEQAVFTALKWLATHQNGDGSWGHDFPQAMTGFALLAFLGHCETPEGGTFAINVQKAIKFLNDYGSNNDGFLAHDHSNHCSYEHAIATYALCEAYTVTKEPTLIPTVQKSVEVILRGQSADGGFAYAYNKHGTDISVAGWNIQALKAAHLTGLHFSNLDSALNKAMQSVKRMQGGSGHWKYQTAHPDERWTLTGIGAYCLQIWESDGSENVREGCKAILAIKDYEYDGDKGNLYSWYYNTMACYQRGGLSWQKWNRIFLEQMLKKQNADGSWPPEGHPCPGNCGGGDAEIMRTCLGTLMLEVYYRYLPSIGKK